MSDALEQADWRICVDFGTSASKASICARPNGAPVSSLVRPLRIGALWAESNPYLAQSALLFDRERIHFGAHAIEVAAAQDVDTDVLQSFKMFLAARDLEAALALQLRRTIEPAGLFTQRDALALYTAYLLFLTEKAAALDSALPEAARSSPRRYVHPLWTSNKQANATVARLFDEAAAIAVLLRPAFESQGGVAYAEARAALDKARASPGEGRVEAGVFEAQAAAESHFAFAAEQLPDYALVFDMGAGTTDLTAFRIRRGDGSPSMEEIVSSRQSVALGCDEIDRILVAMFIERSERTTDQRSKRAFWRRLNLRARRLKETLFAKGVCQATHEGRKIAIRLADLYRDRSYRAFRAAVIEAFRDYLAQLMKHAESGSAVDVVLAGGGARLPFVQKMATAASPAARTRLRVRPVAPAWINGQSFDPGLVASFPQVAVAIGGAVASISPGGAKS